MDGNKIIIIICCQRVGWVKPGKFLNTTNKVLVVM